MKLAIQLFHGRDYAATNLDEWGVKGPTIPITSASQIYGTLRLDVPEHLHKLLLAGGWRMLGGLLEAAADEDCIRLADVSYGEFTIGMFEEGEIALTADDLYHALGTAHMDMLTLAGVQGVTS